MKTDPETGKGFIFGVCLLALLATLVWSGAPAQAQSAPTLLTPPASDVQNPVSVAPDVRDSQIADRLRRIMQASEWFDPLGVSVREGIVFLDGQTETDERQEWARQLALRTENVVAVVNRIEVKPTISWDLTPTWREIEKLADRVQWLAPILVVAVIVLLIAWALSRGVSALARRWLRGRIVSPLLLNLVARALAIPVILIGIYIVLQVAGLTRLALTVLGGTGLIGIVLGLAFREIAENSLASILLSVRNPFRAGDWIEVGDFQGIVQNLNMRTTVLLTLDGNHVQIPNALVFKSVIKNFSTNPNRRTEFGVGIGYDDSVLEAQNVIIRALRAHPAVLDDPEPNVLVDELGASTVNLRVQFWFDGRSYSIFKIRSALMRQVKRALQDGGISMPDEAREIIFPDGVPIRRLPQAGSAPPATPERRADSGEEAMVTVGEGDLLSEKDDLERQAGAADLPEAAENLLTPEPPR
ncbi:mechanosensitive ion channel family protein [Roseovarius dicentrarchi]|uniref:mechanosensitive ion channel family protein n=1 Tax=Roseovarius dicentrarchi TaxID=2250573 RepID=UPI001396737C|nr:mechanosensitive ion channel family protein [Roseovarius dicentrarchi]